VGAREVLTRWADMVTDPLWGDKIIDLLHTWPVVAQLGSSATVWPKRGEAELPPTVSRYTGDGAGVSP